MVKSESRDFHDVGEADGYDAVVVGSGYGGSVAACRMSMAGFKVCLLEKGRRWEPQDFPTDSFKMMSAVRMENNNLGFSFGAKDSLFQLNIQDDALAATACGLGGGSLVNAGVMLPTPVRTRRHPKWPKAWEKDWEICHDSASDMLGIQNTTFKFPNTKIMEQVIDKGYDKNVHNPLKLSINFEVDDPLSDSKKSRETGSCLACGNCLSGCPYNAKNSTDKTYLASAVQEGCTIRTECEVQYVVRNEDDMVEDKQVFKRRSQRRWLVYFSEFDYVSADFVILSAGVFGTSKILFQSQLRGLSISEKLGTRLSCNGNNVAYLAGSSAPLNAFGLNRKQFSNVPFHERPGPSISSSYTSSLGFTIQAQFTQNNENISTCCRNSSNSSFHSAVVPAAYPRFLFKGLATYRSQSDYGFLDELRDRLKDLSGLNRSQAMVLNAMGYDDGNGELRFEKDTNRILFQPPHDPLLPQKVQAFQKIAKKLGGTLFMSRYRSTSVHLLGGCITSSDVSSGVCNPTGQVFDSKYPTAVHPGLYICDASIIPCSVGVNPCLTIATAAEHVSRRLVQEAVKHFVNGNCDKKPSFISNDRMDKKCYSEVMARENMRGKIGGLPCTTSLNLKFKNSQIFDKNTADGKSYPLLRGKVGGHIVCKGVEVDKMYIIHGEVDLCETDVRTPYTQYMHYHLILGASSGSRYILEGKKILNPYLLALYAWKESTTLHVTLRKLGNNIGGEEKMNLKGTLRISLMELLKTICSLKGRGLREFIFLFMQSLFRTYILQTPRGSNINVTPMEFVRKPYPNSTTRDIKTDDGLTINCQHWQCSHSSAGELKLENKLYPILLINGYATESYCLPTEPNDLVRTLLKEGHDVWLLRARLHISNSPNNLSVEDIGRIDVTAAIGKIIEFHGESTKVHVVAHCVGGLAVHIALMGGHVSAKKIASLSCTNSSMFFKLNTSSSVKMWLPLLPILMKILGKNKTLPMLQTSPTSLRYRLLKSIARLIPRYERCTCDECEVFSGIFGNVFWHENISHTLHHWMNKEYLPRLPLAAFPHLRKICNAGHILDASGRNLYLIHPERMAVPTLYISGGRTLLVTPETSFLANKYMKLHQPSYRHERVVVDGFGHSDLLIGEKSPERVFPFIVKHIELAEDERSCASGDAREVKLCSQEALAWSVDPYYDGGGFGSWVFSLVTVVVLFWVVFLLTGFL